MFFISGGTESILMAVLAARQKAYHERGITEPEMILPNTAHTGTYLSYFHILRGSLLATTYATND